MTPETDIQRLVAWEVVCDTCMGLGYRGHRPHYTEGTVRALPRPKKKRKPAPNTCSCGHAADMTFEWAPGHRGGLICDCCIKKIWENTLANITKSLTELKMRCPVTPADTG